MTVPGMVLGAAFTIYNIVPFSPGFEELAQSDAAELAAVAGVDLPLYSLTLDPAGSPPQKQLETAIASYRRFRDALAYSGMRPGVLVQAILGHAWRGSIAHTNLVGAAWTKAVCSDGDERRYCPLDPAFEAYIDDVFTAIARERPRFILTDDDVRAYVGGKTECFCERHVALFNARRGTSYSSAELRDRIRAARQDDPDYVTFLAIQRETVEGVLRRARAAIDRVDPTIPGGISVAGQEHLFCVPMARAFAAKGQRPVMRASCSNYLKRMSAAEVPMRYARMQSIVEYYKDADVDILCEADTWPHNLWSKTARSFFTHMTLGAFCGMTGAKAWCVNAHKSPDLPVSRNYTRIMAENRGFLDALAKEVEGSEPVGISLLCLTNFPGWHAINGTDEYFYDTGDGEDWRFVPFTVPFGIPYRFSREPAKGLYFALQTAGEVDRLTDDDVRNLFTRPVLVLKEAADALRARGLDGLVAGRSVETDYGYKRLPWFRFSEKLKQQIVSQVDHVAGAPVPFVAGHDQDVLMQARAKPDGSFLVLAVNLASDPIRRLTLRAPTSFGTVERLRGDGTWAKVAFRRLDEWVETDVPVAFEEAVVIRFRPPPPDQQRVRVFLTFDDGVRSHLRVAAPELERRGWRGLFCIVTDWIGKDEHKLTWDDVRELVGRGHEIAVHTKSHPNLRALAEKDDRVRLREEIASARDRIEAETGVRPRFLCLPYTAGHPLVTEIAREAGLETMLLTRHGFGVWTQPGGVARCIDEIVARGEDRADFLVHGIMPGDGGWKPFVSREAFVAYLDELKALERAGRVDLMSDFDMAALPLRKGALVLSFDDRNFADWEKAIPLFDKYGAHATFFFCGPVDDEAKGPLKALAAKGHSIGLHGLKHQNADDAVTAMGAEAYFAEEIEPQLAGCRAAGIRVTSFAYPNSRCTDETDALFRAKGFTHIRGGHKGVAPYDPKGEKQAGLQPLHAVDRIFFPTSERENQFRLDTVIAGEAYHTDIEDVLACIRRCAERNEVFVLTSHGIAPDAKHINMKTEWLERILATAKECGVPCLGFDEL